MGGSGKGKGVSSGDASPGGQLKYEETMRVLNRQATVLAELRNRANILLAANAIVAALFGTSALGKHHLLALKILALAVFALGIGACVAIIWSVPDKGTLVDPDRWPKRLRWPRKEAEETEKAKEVDIRRWQVTFDLGDVVDYITSTDVGRVTKISEKFELARKTNWETIDRRTDFLQIASVLLAVQIIIWSCLVLV